MGDYSLGTHFVVSLNGLDSSLKGTDPRFMYMYTDKYFQQILSTTHYHGEKKTTSMATCSINVSNMRGDEVKIAEFNFNIHWVSFNFGNLVSLTGFK